MKSIYTLKELNEAKLKGTFAGNRLKRFYSRATKVYKRELKASFLIKGININIKTIEA